MVLETASGPSVLEPVVVRAVDLHELAISLAPAHDDEPGAHRGPVNPTFLSGANPTFLYWAYIRISQNVYYVNFSLRMVQNGMVFLP